MTEQLIRKDSPAAPPRRNTTQTPTIQHNPYELHPGVSACNGLRWNHGWNHDIGGLVLVTPPCEPGHRAILDTDSSGR